jgi:hypothetical protein
MRFDFKHNKDDIIEFLNSTADSFYNGKLEFLDRSYDSRYKANLLGGMIDVERTIRGVFGCDLSLETADYDLIKQMYPHACDMLSINDQNDLSKLSQLLNSLRDLNAHAFLSDTDIAFIKNDFSMLLSEKKMHGSLIYLRDGCITIAGITYLILNFLRSQSIATMVRDDFMVAVVSSGQYAMDNGERFVSEISRVDLEVSIRKVKADDVLGSIFGEYSNRLVMDGGNFSFSIGKEKYPTFKVTGSLNKNRLTIESGSLTRTYYSNNYSLKIDDKDYFINLSNSLPMMALVDFLYGSNIEIFDREAVNKVNKEFELFSKTNKPKFYADKKLSLLLYKSAASDFRIISSLMVDALSRIFLSLENFIYRTRGIQRRNRSGSYEYSTIGKALKHIGVPDEIVTEVKYLRNFCAHGYMLNDYLLFKDDVRQFTLGYIIATIKQLSDYLEVNVKDVYNNFKEYKREFLINKVVKTKYKVAIAYSDIVIDEFPNYNRVELSKKNGFISNSFFDITIFNEITNFEIQRTRVIELLVEDINQYLYFFENEKSKERIDFFCSCFGYEIIDKKDYGLIIEMTAKKVRK